MTVEKVVVTKEVAEAITEIERKHISLSLILANHAHDTMPDMYASLRTLDIEDLAKALIVGYTVEKSPEDKVREYYERCIENRRLARSGGRGYAEENHDGQAIGASITLDILGIKIEGVNA